jgi:GxxExxY protein
MKYSDITEKIIGCAMKVHKELGFGFQEYVYHRALEIELKTSHLKFISEYETALYYSGEKIGLRGVDFFVDDKIMVEIKAVTHLEDQRLAQALNYLEASVLEIGYSLILKLPLFNLRDYIIKSTNLFFLKIHDKSSKSRF